MEPVKLQLLGGRDVPPPPPLAQNHKLVRFGLLETFPRYRLYIFLVFFHLGARSPFSFFDVYASHLAFVYSLKTSKL